MCGFIAKKFTKITASVRNVGLSERSPDGIIAEYRLLHELALLPSKNRVVQRNPLNLGSKGLGRWKAA
jgi:hypothetical protein